MAYESNGWQQPTSNGLWFSQVDIESHARKQNLESDDDLPLSALIEKLSTTCDKCGFTSTSLSKLRSHLKQYKNEHGYCNHCKSIKNAKHRCKGNNRSGTNSKTDGKLDMRQKGRRKTQIVEEKPFRCDECSLSFGKESGLKVHRKFVHKSVTRKCPTCEEILKSEEDFLNHMGMHGPDDRIVCKNCRAEFTTMKQYRTHAKFYPAPHNFLCKSCLRQFSTETRLEDHTCICINGQPLICACGESFCTYTSVVEHARGSKPFRCCSCDHASITLRGYMRHVRRHSQQKPYNCVKCSTCFSSLEIWKNHMKNVHEDDFSMTLVQNLDCLVCGEKFDCTSKLKAHMATHNERVPCPECGKTVRTYRLEAHRAKHTRSSCLCPDCGKLFESHFRFTQHMQSAHVSKPVTCDICNKSLKTKKILTEHLKTHLKTEIGTRVAQAVCPVCGLELAQKGSLGRHILLVHERHRIVEDNQPVICKECGVTLPNKSKYYTHRRQHRAMVERFPCAICSREFNKKQNLVRHMHLLHDSKRILDDPCHTCDVCHRVFRERKNLARHYRAVHQKL